MNRLTIVEYLIFEDIFIVYDAKNDTYLKMRATPCYTGLELAEEAKCSESINKEKLDKLKEATDDK